MVDIIIALIVIGILLWSINSFITMDAKIKQLINVVVIVAVVFWLVKTFGLLKHLPR